MRVLITGITGFIGSHLMAALLRDGSHTITGLTRRLSPWPFDDQVTLREIDYENTDQLSELLDDVEPDWLFHLAGFASPRLSVQEPEACHQANFVTTERLYEAVCQSRVNPRILLTSTGLVYAAPTEGEVSFDEESPLKPATPYAASKLEAERLSQNYVREHGLKIVCVRLFNQIGPGQSRDYAIANFARQIAAIENGQQEPRLETYSLEGRRDIADVRDMVEALILLIQHGVPGEVYNAGRGSTRRIGDLLQKMLTLSSAEIEVVTQGDATPERSIVCANPTKLKQATGWEPRYNIDQTLSDILNDWRNRVHSRARSVS